MDNLDKAFDLMEKITDLDFQVIRRKSELDFMMIALRRDLFDSETDFAQDKYDEMKAIMEERNKLAEELKAIEW